MIEVTFSKQWIHFLRSDLCPPTSTILQGVNMLVKLLETIYGKHHNNTNMQFHNMQKSDKLRLIREK